MTGIANDQQCFRFEMTGTRQTDDPIGDDELLILTYAIHDFMEAKGFILSGILQFTDCEGAQQ